MSKYPSRIRSAFRVLRGMPVIHKIEFDRSVQAIFDGDRRNIEISIKARPCTLCDTKKEIV